MVGEVCLGIRVQRASRAVSRAFDEVLRPLGLNNWQFSLLMAADKPEPLTIGELAALLVMDRTTTTAVLKPLERQGLLEVRRDRDDARARRVVLTDAGSDMILRAVGSWRTVNDALAARLGDADVPEFRSALDRIAEFPG
jgi:DNA-binding MarR family transcriptional regulator